MLTKTMSTMRGPSFRPPLLLYFIFNYMYMYTTLYWYAHMHAGALGGQEKGLHSMELRLQIARSRPTAVIGVQLSLFPSLPLSYFNGQERALWS